MNVLTLQSTYGGLLHDTGKAVYRAGGQRGSHSEQGYQFLHGVLSGADWAPVLDCVHYHHAAALRGAAKALPADSPAYIVYLADDLSAAADRREVEGESSSFRRDLPLDSVFTHLNGSHPGWMMPAQPQDGSLKLPRQQQPLSASVYADAVRKLSECLPDLQPQPEWINSLLGLLETQFSCFPSSTFTGESPDVSLFDHAKTTAAIAACISEYVQANSITDLRKALFEQEKDFCQKGAFLLYTADFSRIQKFLYTVHTENALRSLRSRSFFLELLMEHYLDELLAGCGVSRANLIYSGGGHCYVLLPNTEKAVRAIQAWNTRFNDFLIEQFGVRLYLADGYTPCSANDLTNTPAEEAPYQAMFHRVSHQVAKKKLHRYSVQQLRRMNQSHQDPGQRECRICGRTDALRDGEEDTCICLWCALFESLSRKIQGQDVYVVSRDAAGADFTLPAAQGELSFILTNEARARQLLTGEGVARVYTKNRFCAGLRCSTRIYVGDYAADNSMAALAGASEGVPRLGVCRMDVDNLGQSFVSGYECAAESDPVKRQHFVTLSRTAAFSRQMSLFFKGYINPILSGEFEHCRALQVAVVYYGGDDVFLVGAWTDVLEGARRIREALRRYTCGALTISAGIGIYGDHFPIRQAASLTAGLEDEAKSLPHKDGIALFAAGDGHCYPWDTYLERICGEKLVTLEQYFSSGDSEHGTAFLYRLMELLRQAQAGGGIALARYAYLLARLEPKRNAPNYPGYKRFSEDMYRWALNSADRGELLTAICIYVYRNRKRG